MDFAYKKVTRSIGVLNKLKAFTPYCTMKNLCYSLIYSYLNYCNLAWGGTFSAHLNPPIILQKKAIRIINFKLQWVEFWRILDSLQAGKWVSVSCQVEWNVRLHRQFFLLLYKQPYFRLFPRLTASKLLLFNLCLFQFAMNLKFVSMCVVHHVKRPRSLKIIRECCYLAV